MLPVSTATASRSSLRANQGQHITAGGVKDPAIDPRKKHKKYRLCI